jgi:hypothetical protein
MKQNARRAVAIILVVTLASLIDVRHAGRPYSCGRYDDTTCVDDDDDWKCIAGGREVWKLFCQWPFTTEESDNERS